MQTAFLPGAPGSASLEPRGAPCCRSPPARRGHPPERPAARWRTAQRGLDRRRRLGEGSASGLLWDDGLRKGDLGRRGGWVYCIHCYRRIDIDPADVGDLVPETSTREELMERLLGDCVVAIEALLASPDLNLDCLEQATRDAIEAARETLHAVRAELE